MKGAAPSSAPPAPNPRKVALRQTQPHLLDALTAQLSPRDLSDAQRARIAQLDQPHVVRRSHTEGVATVYVYHQMSVSRYLIDSKGGVVDIEQFRAGSSDRAVRQQLLAARFGRQLEEGQHGSD